jgi:hypothetical protein
MARKSASTDPSIQSFATAEEVNGYLQTLEESTTQAAAESAQKMETTVTINGQPVRCTVTPPVRAGRKPYTLFYVGEKRKAKKTIPTVILAS